MFILFLLLMSCLVVFIYLNIFYFIRLKVPTLSTKDSAFKKILEHIDFQGRKKFYDLGSGSGKLISRVAENYPELKCVGIEYNITAYFLARIRNFFSKNKVDYQRNDFFKIGLYDADIVYAYLFPGIMNRLETKFCAELKSGALVIANSFPLKSKKPKNVIRGSTGGLDTLYIYEY